MKFRLMENINFNFDYSVKANLELNNFKVDISSDNLDEYDTRYNSIIDNDDIDTDLSKSIRELIQDIIVTIGINKKYISSELKISDFDFNYDSYFDISDEDNLYIDFMFSCNKEIEPLKLEKVLNKLIKNEIEFSSESEFKESDEEDTKFYCEGSFKVVSVDVDINNSYEE